MSQPFRTDCGMRKINKYMNALNTLFERTTKTVELSQMTVLEDDGFLLHRVLWQTNCTHLSWIRGNLSAVQCMSVVQYLKTVGERRYAMILRVHCQPVVCLGLCVKYCQRLDVSCNTTYHITDALNNKHQSVQEDHPSGKRIRTYLISIKSLYFHLKHARPLVVFR